MNTKVEEWQAKLIGKIFEANSDDTAKISCNDLPPERRIFNSKNLVGTMDYKPERLNLYLDDNNVIYKVHFG